MLHLIAKMVREKEISMKEISEDYINPYYIYIIINVFFLLNLF